MRLTILTACVASIACSIPAVARARDAEPARWGSYSFELVDEAGRVLPTYSHRGRTYVLGSVGQRYLVRVRNGSPGRVEVVVSVDGRDVRDGGASEWSKRGYLVDAYTTVTIDGFRLSQDAVAAFRFSTVPRSYAALQGDSRDAGVVGVAVFTSVNCGTCFTFVNVQVVIFPDCTVISLMVLPDFVPVTVVPSSSLQTASVRSHPVTSVSATEYDVPTGRGKAPVVPVPVTLLLMEPGVTLKLNWVVVSLPAALSIFRKPPPGVTMQSNGLPARNTATARCSASESEIAWICMRPSVSALKIDSGVICRSTSGSGAVF